MFEIDNSEHVDDAFVLDAETALDMADERNVLYIQGGIGDTLTMLGDWDKDAARHHGEDGRVYTRYTAMSKGRAIEVYVASDIALND